MAEVVQRLRTPHSSALTHWQGVDLSAAVRTVHESRAFLGGQGARLPMVWLRDAVVVPVVTWDHVALAERIANCAGPVLVARRIRDEVIPAGPTHLDPVLEPLGFITISPYRRARGALAVLRMHGPVAALLPCAASEWEAFTCDARGHTLVQTRGGRQEVVVAGGLSARRGSFDEPIGPMLLREQLYDLALRSSQVPTHTSPDGVR